MPKVTEIKYICDRCGRDIKGFPHALGKWRMFFKWFIPANSRYKTAYICEACWESFKDWFVKGAR